ncbi:adenylate/guanylate cyclase domain-containing protein [Aureimonas leprariae]|uniref:Adenylate/guanylate cyclase domain-containing protein n=1 Tax=Plantimonas leprariae TaxID=2615207 RepID=A0A7V7PP21_9HYPH|nr:adenylate/guanylate cyclase domain-containing protein [Aureimonas leprariae]KAB0679624.1 adenylate/guanylate cyclase domain-containing protein [Aureimonas leprariae]
MLKAVAEIDALITERSLAGDGELALLRAFSEAAVRHGLPLWRVLFIVDTLHPVYEGRAFRWRNDGVEEDGEMTYGRTDEGEARERWETSAFYRLYHTGETELRRRFHAGDPADYNLMPELVEEGCSDYLIFMQPFGAEGVIGDLDGIFCQICTRAPDGFSDEDLAVVRALVPKLSVAIKCASLARIATTLVEVYLGRDARERVLKGRIARGVAERIRTVLWFSDLRSFTTITDTADPEEIIPLLNDYSGAAIEAIHGAGGDVLKLIGDGILAIFNFDDQAKATAAALAAERDLRARTSAIDARRREEGRPVTSIYIGLHIGEAFYGNIGSDDRLDFTVVGPSVNEVSRIGAMCRSVDRLMVASDEFRAALAPEEQGRLVSVGRFALRGVGRSQELFTLDPALL